jgi:hypothetical protein
LVSVRTRLLDPDEDEIKQESESFKMTNKEQNAAMTPASSITIDKPLTRDMGVNHKVPTGRVDGFTLTGRINQSITLEKRSDHNATDREWNLHGVLRHSTKLEASPGDSTYSKNFMAGRGQSTLATQG